MIKILTTLLFLFSANVFAVNLGPKPFQATPLAKGTIFASPTGTGSACLISTPCDVWAAMAKAKSGDVVFLRGGTYAVTKNLIFATLARAENPLIIESYPGEKAAFDGVALAKGTQIYLKLTGAFIKLRNIEVKNMPMQGIWIYGVDNELDAFHSHHNGLSGIMVYSLGTIPYGTSGSRNVIRNCIVHDNSGAGILDTTYANGGNSDGISISSGADNRVENCLVYQNSDDGIDVWQSTNAYIAHNIVHSQGIAAGNGDGIKAGGSSPSFGAVVEHNISYNNKAVGFNYNFGAAIRFHNNTSYGNSIGFKVGADTTLTKNIRAEVSNQGAGIETDNSWQRTGGLSFTSVDPLSRYFLMPNTSGFDDIGAFAR